MGLLTRSIRAAVIIGPIALCCVGGASAADTPLVVAAPAEIKWADTGPMFPNTHVVILDGNPERKVPVTFRWRCPADYKFMPHTHPDVERVTVLSGTFSIGVGKAFDPAALKEVQTGGFIVLPAKAPHFGVCKGETIIEVHTMGPLGTTYVNAAEDPSKKH